MAVAIEYYLLTRCLPDYLGSTSENCGKTFQNMPTFYKPRMAKATLGMVGAAYQRYRGYPAAATAVHRSAGLNTVNSRKYKRQRGSGNSLAAKIRNTRPAKHFLTADTTLAQTLTQGTSYVHSPTMNIAKGTADNQRIGDSVYLEALKFKILAYDDTAITQPVIYQIVFGYIDDDTFNATGWQTGSGYTFGNGTTYGVMSIPDPKKFTSLAEYTIRLPHVLANSETAEVLEDTIQLKKSFTYETGQAYGKDRNLVCFIKGITIGGTTGSTIVGDIILTYDLIFKDSN